MRSQELDERTKEEKIVSLLLEKLTIKNIKHLFTSRCQAN